MKYRIDFYLSDEVTDLEAAQKYLSSDDMTKYLKSDMPNLQDTIQHIEWVLKEKDSGYIELTVSEELDELDLDNIKEWDFIIDNNSDYQTLVKNVEKIVENLKL